MLTRLVIVWSEAFYSLRYFVLFVDIILEISAFRGNIDVPRILSAFREISTFRGYYLHFGDISALHAYYPHSVDTIIISHITSYLARNVRHIIHNFVLVVDIIFGHITSYLACNVRSISLILLI